MYGIALDLGTSGFRMQLVDLNTGKTKKTIITMQHPLPGGNVTDHLDFALHVGTEISNKIIIDTVSNMIHKLNVKAHLIEKMVVCGNPIQLSLFQDIEIRDLAYAGENMQRRLGIKHIDRSTKIYFGKDVFGNSSDLKHCKIIVLPAIKHEIGADALAMMIKTDFIDQEDVSLVTDYGTNAEMALKVGKRIITGSAAAGPSIEGQGIKCGMLASPGAISDINEENGLWRTTVLDDKMNEVQGHLIDPVSGKVHEMSKFKPKGITGTGVIAAISLALSMRIIKELPKLPNGKLHLGNDIWINDNDLSEAGKAIGAIRAAHLTLFIESGVKYTDLNNMYMCGASGTYVDAIKASTIGLSPNFSKKVVQFGNTSLALARDVLLGVFTLDEISYLAEKIKANHLMMALSETFKNIYSCELAYWTEGMPQEMYNTFLESYELPKLPTIAYAPIVERRVLKDIQTKSNEKVMVFDELDMVIKEEARGCIRCETCKIECPEKAIDVVESNGKLYASYKAHKCLGTSCKRCVRSCPEKAISLKKILISQTNSKDLENPTV